MAVKTWKGDAVAVAEVQTLTLTGTWAASETITLTIGGKDVTVTAANGVKSDICVQIMNAWNASTITEFTEITALNSGDTVRLTADTAGIPYKLTGVGGASLITVAETSVSGSAAIAITTAATGPKFWDNADNWAEGTVPGAADDVIFRNNGNDCTYGIDQNGLALASLTIDQSYTGNIGLPRLNSVGTPYHEFRETILVIKPTTLTIGSGEGTGSGRIKIDTGAVAACTTVIENTGAPLESGLEAVLLTGTHANNSLTVRRGSVGVSVLPGQTGSQPTLNIGSINNPGGDARVRCSAGVSLVTVSIAGGIVELNSAITTLTIHAGTVTHRAGAITTVKIKRGVLFDRSVGTITNLTVEAGGTYDRNGELAAKTITNTDLSAKCVYRAKDSITTWSNGVDFNNCGIQDLTFDVGSNIKITVTPL